MYPDDALKVQAGRTQAAVRALVRRFSISERSEVACCGMTVAQAATLQCLDCCGPVRLSELSDCLGISPSTLTRNFRRLQQRGLVRKQADPADARASVAALTEAGRAAALDLRRQEEGFALSVLERIPEDRRQQVTDSLELLLEAVREATRECCGEAFDHLVPESMVCQGEEK